MKRIAVITAAVAIVVIMVVTAVDAYRSHSFAVRARSIRIGDSREEVRVGRPIAVLTPSQTIPIGMYRGVKVETWVYGGQFDWRHCLLSEFPYFYPFRFRLFGADSDDVTIEFDRGGKVSRVLIPGT